MSDKFRMTQMDIKSEQSFRSGKIQIDVEQKLPRVVKSYDYQKIRTNQNSSVPYDAFDLPSLDTSGTSSKRAVSRFKLSELAREQLPVREEEQREIEQKVRAQVEAISQETYEAARQTGFVEGLELGRKQAFEEYSKQAAPKLDSLSALVGAFESIQSKIHQANERFIIELIMRIARKVCLKELQSDEKVILRWVQAMITQSGARENIRIRLNPAQMDTLQELRSALTASLGDLKNLQVGISAEVPVGACEVDTEFNNLVGSLDLQLEAIRDGVLQVQLPGGGEGEKAS